MIFALTDFLVVIGAGIACFALLAEIRRPAAWLALIGFDLFGLAALAGTIRFASGQVDSWAGLHAGLSDLAGSAGLVLIAFALLQSRARRPVSNPAAVIFAAIAIGAAGGVILFAPESVSGASFLLAMTATALIAGVWGGAVRIAAGQARLGLAWLGLWAGLLILAQGVGGSREEMLFGVARWHVYHAGLALWLVGAGQAMRAALQAATRRA